VTGWLLDTNVLSELRRPRPDARVRKFIAGQRLEDLFVSTVTFAEIRFGIEIVSDPIRRAELTEWLTHRVRPLFDQRVLEVSEDVMFKWRLLVEEGRKAGHTFWAVTCPDCLNADSDSGSSEPLRWSRGDSTSYGVVFSSGHRYIRNRNGRCEDAPCCGCCTI
jgi:predicted nucleic acid-binding protein